MSMDYKIHVLFSTEILIYENIYEMDKEELQKTKNKFEIRDVVRLKDGDGRPHTITGMFWTFYSRPLPGQPIGYWTYEFEDGGRMNEYNLSYYINPKWAEFACEQLDTLMHVIPVDDEFSVICNENSTPFSKKEFIQKFKKSLLENKKSRNS